MSIIGDLYYGALNRIATRKEQKHIHQVIRSFIADDSLGNSDEISQIKTYYKNGGTSPFPYNLEEQEKSKKTEILYEGLPYVMHNSRKLFFPKTFGEDRIDRLYRGLIIEQDQNCPHCYTQNHFDVPENGILIDVGCADAMFSLDHIELVQKLILFETNEYWIEALEKTFEPWKHKVQIVNAFVSDSNSQTTVALSKFILEDDLDNNFYLKIDVEGAERQVLRGALDFLNSAKNIQVAIATYHYNNDNEDLTKLLGDLNFETSNTEGYILFYYDKAIKSPYLRRCILQAVKKE